MAQLMDHVYYLAKEIGPRPAGTEEEQQAALYITEQFQKEAGFTANIEEFTSTSNLEGGRAIMAGVVVVVTILAMIFPVLSIPAFILAAAAAALYALEALDRPIISGRLASGVSQNVVAKYQPNPDAEVSGRMRSRKLVVVAHYDTARVKPALVRRLEATGLPILLIGVIAMGVSALFLLLRIFISTSGGGPLVILNILSILALVVCLVPIVKTVLTRTSSYNEGANNNATGTAALIEVARRISRGSISEADLAQGENGDVVIHGEEAARSSGLVPEGAQIRYEAEQIAPPAEIGEYDEEERLLAAKAAIAALTGKPVERKVYGSVADHLVNSRAHASAEAYPTDHEVNAAAGANDHDMQPYADHGQRFEVNEPVEAAPLPQRDVQPEPPRASVDGFENAPSWFVAAQKNAKRTESADAGEIHRSRYTEAMEQGERARREREEALLRERQEQEEAMLRAREEQASEAAAAYAQNLMTQDEPSYDEGGEDQGVRDDSRAFADEVEASGEDFPVEQPSAEEGADYDEGFDEVVQPRRRVSSKPVFEPAFSEEDFPDDPMLDIAYERGMRTVALEQEDVEEEAPLVLEQGDDVQVEPAQSLGAAPEVIDVDPAEEEDAAQDPGSTRAFPGYAQLDAEARRAADIADAAAADSADAAAVHTRAASGERGAGRSARHSEASEARSARPRHAITLPELDLAEPEPRKRVAGLPSIESSAEPRRRPSVKDDPSRSSKLRELRTSVPSLSGVIRSKNEARQAVASSLPSVVNVPTPLVDDDKPEEPVLLQSEELEAPAARRRVAEEVDYEMEVPIGSDVELEDDHAGALEEDAPRAAEPRRRASGAGDAGALGDDASTRAKMPKSRAGGFLSRFHRQEEELDDTPQEWLKVDDDFDARSVGRARGGWESFRDDRFEESADELLAETEEYGEPAPSRRRSSKRDWEGGAYSRMSLGHVDMRSGEDAEADEVIPDEPPEAEIGRSITGEIEQIYHFRNPSFNTEIWFVAVGSDTDAHDGAKAFIEEHRNELRGSMVIEIESLGAGTLSVASQEGSLRKVTASSRVKRLTRDAVAKTGLSLDEVSLVGSDSIASTVQKAGFQSMHLFGAEGGMPALKGSADDTMENVDESALDDNVNFLYEVLKSQ